MRIIFIAAALLIAGNACASTVECPLEKEKAALDQFTEKPIPQDWDALYTSFKQFKQCDDGAIADGYSDTIVQTLAKHWDALPKLAQFADADKGFRLFVLKHIDATTDDNDLKKIIDQSQKRCPAGLEGWCKSLSVAAKDAYAEMLQPQ